MQVDGRVIEGAPQAFDEVLSIHRPLPSMEMTTPNPLRTAVSLRLVLRALPVDHPAVGPGET